MRFLAFEKLKTGDKAAERLADFFIQAQSEYWRPQEIAKAIYYMKRWDGFNIRVVKSRMAKNTDRSENLNELKTEERDHAANSIFFGGSDK